MSMIMIAVTSGVLRQEKVDRLQARQLAIRGGSKVVMRTVRKASKMHMVSILLADRVKLLIGDNGAIWRSHNPQAQREFDLLFDLLALKPDASMQFGCELMDLPNALKI
jgi:hypothetical protein